MMLTEQEAKERWCPFARVLDGRFSQGAAGNFIAGAAASVNRTKSTDLSEGLCCIASQCMAWRWGSKLNPDWSPHHHMMHVFPRDPRTEIPQYIADFERGFCGLAGQPS